LKREIRVELDEIDRVVQELTALHEDVGEGDPTLREQAAAGQFLGAVYMGVENIFKRAIRYYGLDMPEGKNWHVQLFRRFRAPTTEPLPVLLHDELAEKMKPFRGVRHVIRHGYPRELEWDRMREGLQEARPVFDHFRDRVEQFLAGLDDEASDGGTS